MYQKNDLLVLSRWKKRLIMIIADLIIILFSLWGSFALRLGMWNPPLGDGIWLLVIAPLVSVSVFIRLGLYRAIIRYLGGQAFLAVFKGVLLSTVMLAAIALIFDFKGVPRSVFVIFSGASLLLVGGSRYLIRHCYQSVYNSGQRINVAIYGASYSGAQLAKALQHSKEYRAILFLDNDASLHDSFILGLRVFNPKDLATLLDGYQIKQLLLAMPSIGATDRQKILNDLAHLPVYVRTIPNFVDLVLGKRRVEELREIEVNDLLGRPVVTPNVALLECCVTSKNILVTGAGGSIGSELCRQIIRLKPKYLVLLDLSEFALYKIDQELSTICKNEKRGVVLIPVLGSVQDRQRIEEVLEKYKIDTLYHAAAYKHVPMVEYNPIEGIRNNIYGTLTVAQSAQSVGVKHFILISTDKAVRPTNIMGATKRMAELILQGLAQSSTKTIFSMVRFGNVLGSSGSVVPLFRKQIKNGGPVTVTHADITRYFMSIPEAAQLVIQAGSMAKGGEVFVLDMGESVKIYELARQMILLSGLAICGEEENEAGCIKIEVTGLRPGEKLYEELLIGESPINTLHNSIFKAREQYLSWEEFKMVLVQLDVACQCRDMTKIHSLLRRYVQGFSHSYGKLSAKNSMAEKPKSVEYLN